MNKKERGLIEKLVNLGEKALKRELSDIDKIKLSECLVEIKKRLKQSGPKDKLEQIKMNFDGQNL